MLANMGPGFGPGPADMFSGAALGPAFGSMSGPSEINGGLMGPAMSQIGLGTGFNPNDASLNLYGNAQEPVIEFFEDPSLYDDYQKNQPAQLEEASSELVNFIINGPSDFGMVISNFSNTSSLNIKYNFLINQARLIQFPDQTIMNMTVQLKILDGILSHQHHHKQLRKQNLMVVLAQHKL